MKYPVHSEWNNNMNPPTNISESTRNSMDEIIIWFCWELWIHQNEAKHKKCAYLMGYTVLRRCPAIQRRPLPLRSVLSDGSATHVTCVCCPTMHNKLDIHIIICILRKIPHALMILWQVKACRNINLLKWIPPTKRQQCKALRFCCC